MNDTLAGISICVELNHLMEGGEKIFCVLFVGNMAAHTRDMGPILGSKLGMFCMRTNVVMVVRAR